MPADYRQNFISKLKKKENEILNIYKTEKNTTYASHSYEN